MTLKGFAVNRIQIIQTCRPLSIGTKSFGFKKQTQMYSVQLLVRSKKKPSLSVLARFKHRTLRPTANLKGKHNRLVNRPVHIVTIIMHIWHSTTVLRKRVHQELHTILYLAKSRHQILSSFITTCLFQCCWNSVD